MTIFYSLPEVLEEILIDKLGPRITPFEATEIVEEQLEVVMSKLSGALNG